MYFIVQVVPHWQHFCRFLSKQPWRRGSGRCASLRFWRDSGQRGRADADWLVLFLWDIVLFNSLVPHCDRDQRTTSHHYILADLFDISLSKITHISNFSFEYRYQFLISYMKFVNRIQEFQPTNPPINTLESPLLTIRLF